MNDGYVKLWRKSLDSELLKNHKLWAFWSWCLMKASYRHVKITVGCQEVVLEPGQFVFGRNAASKELNMTEQNIRTIVRFLEKSENLTIKSTNKFSIISIVNWDRYQSNENVNQPSNQQTTNQQLTTNKKEKKYKKENIYDQNSLIDSVSSEISQPTSTSNKPNPECSAKKKPNLSEQLSISFGLFWTEYPRKISKKSAESAWKRINPQNGTVEKIISALKEQKKTEQWQKNNGQFIPHPSTWLNQERWKDEITCSDTSEQTDWSYWENL